MPTKSAFRRLICVGIFSFTLCSCFHPPYNNFQEDRRTLRHMAFGTAAGAGVGAVMGTVAGNAGVGTLIGGLAGATIGYKKNTKSALLRELQKQDIQIVQYGDTTTLVVPTDHYFEFNSPRLNELCYPGLINIVRLIKLHPNSIIYVAGFTDNIGSRHHKRMLSQAQAETMLTFLWANDIPAQLLHAEGYADKHPIGDNQLIHGSAYNRRIEIQWFNVEASPNATPHFGVIQTCLNTIKG